MIKDLYDGFPERVGKKLAEMKAKGSDVSTEDRLQREKQAEIDFLKDNGLGDKAIRQKLPRSQDPVTAGVPKPKGVLRATEL